MRAALQKPRLPRMRAVLQKRKAGSNAGDCREVSVGGGFTVIEPRRAGAATGWRVLPVTIEGHQNRSAPTAELTVLG